MPVLTPPVQTPSGYTILKGSAERSESSCYLLQFDGLCIPNPGTATAGAVLFSPDDRQIVFERGEFVGAGTNNVAEYTGLLIGVQSAADFGIKALLIEGDSALVIQQTGGKWKVNNEALRVLNTEIRNLLLTRFDFVALRHVFRTANVAADKITNDVYKAEKSFYRVV